MKKLSVAVGVLLVVSVVGCAGVTNGTPTNGGQVEAVVVSSAPSGVDPTPLSKVENEQIRRATEQAVVAFDSNGTAETVTIPVPRPALDETERAYERLPESQAEESLGRFVVYRDRVVRVLLLVYS